MYVDNKPTIYILMGGISLTDTSLLREKIDQSGYKMRYIASKLGITLQGFLNKINNKTEFKAKEIQILYNLLNLTESERERIFFAE